jgi:hypothetical protein
MKGSSAFSVRASAPRISSTVAAPAAIISCRAASIVEQEVDRAGQHVAVAHDLGAAAVDQPLIGLAEVLDVAPASTAVSSIAGSSGFCPPSDVSERPTKAISVSRR